MGREESSSVRAGDIVRVAITLGLIVGFGEVCGLGWRYFIRGVLTHISAHVVWMAPLGYAVLFLLLTPIALLARQAGRGLATVVFLGTSIGLVGWITMLPWTLHIVAVLILAGGAALQLARLAHRRADFVTGVARRAAPALAILAVVGGATVFGIYWRAERSALAGIGEASPEAPNVLLIVLDTVRAKSLGLFGGSPTVSPSIDALGAEYVVFENAMATAPWTLPSHASMFTGRLPHELSVTWTAALDGAEPTLAEVLADQGYETAGFVANLSYTSRAYGLARGFARYEDFPVNVGQVVLSTAVGRTLSTSELVRETIGWHELLNRKDAGRINRDFLDWVDRRDGVPFFAFLNYFDAHEPYLPPEEIREVVAPGYDRTRMRHRHNLLHGVNARRSIKAETDSTELPFELALYEGAIQALDLEIGHLMSDLEERGLLENTIVVITSDHGEHVGEHWIFEHGTSLYRPVIHVPLLIRPSGGIAGGRTVDRAVSIRDIPATILDLATGDADGFPGASLAPTWSEIDAEREEARVSLAVSELHRGIVEQPWYPIASGLDMQSMLSGSLYYICNPDASEEMYDLATDPEEADNLAGTPHGDQAILAFRGAIAPIGALPRWCPPAEDQPPRRPERSR